MEALLAQVGLKLSQLVMIASCTATSARVNALLCVDGDDHASDHQRTPRLAPRGDPGRFTRHCRSVDRIGAQLSPAVPVATVFTQAEINADAHLQTTTLHG
jgi:hypothetical protein